MKNLKFYFSKLILVFTVLLGVNAIIFINLSMTTSTRIDSQLLNDSLKTENAMLRNNYNDLVSKLSLVENNLLEIHKYDLSIYSQLLGLNIDSTDIQIYYENYAFDTLSVDSIYAKLDSRMCITSELSSQKLNEFFETSELLKKNKSIINSYPTISPIKKSDLVEISSGFGWRTHPIYHTPMFHDGVDLSAEVNTKIYATMSGKIEEIEYSNRGYGNKIIIKNTYGYETLYAHLKTIGVKKGQYVKKGQLIGTVGDTGTSTGYHLHYEVRKNNKLQDPLAYFITYLNENNDYLASK